ncbi:MAG: hypothetical protein OK438_08235 [Thaumarchaeota archaeon]|nr:hypothetical protein [Nitrososphaerota archaeon]
MVSVQTEGPANQSGDWFRSVLSFLKTHPVICLLLLTPGIPEYLSSSSPLNAIVLNPFMFLFQLAANLGLYGPGVLLIHEGKVRWSKGWASVLILGAAYGILEEGVALSTLFNPDAGPVGSLGQYGHWLGVNWVWAAGIVPFHAIFSVSVPILLLGLALPRTVEGRLLSTRGVAGASAILVADVLILMAVVARASGYWMGWGLLLSSLAVMGFLVLAGRRVSARALSTRTELPLTTPRRMAIIGVAFFPAVFLTQSIGRGAGVSPSLDFVLVLLVQALFLFYVIRKCGSRGNARVLLSLSLGLILPIAAIGVIAELPLPLTLLADVALALFFRKLWEVSGEPPDREGLLGRPSATT